MKKGPDLFQVLNKISKCDVDYFNNLSADDKKSLAPFLLMRWLTGTYDKKQIINLNHIVNPLVFSLYKHQDLALKLLMACSSFTGRLKYVKKTAKLSKRPVALKIIAKYNKCSMLEARNYLDLYTKEDIIELIDILGEDQALLKELDKE